jgi:hypothetical protein
MNVIWTGPPNGGSQPHVQVTKIVGDAWVAAELGSDLGLDGGGTPPGICQNTDINPCGGGGGGGGTGPTNLTEFLQSELDEPEFTIEVVQKNVAIDPDVPKVGDIIALTWPRHGLDGAFLIQKMRRRMWVSHQPGEHRNETTFTLIRLPGYDENGNPLHAIVDVSIVDGPDPIV